MPIQLPTGPVKASRTSPKMLILYSMPKVGKTFMESLLPSNLILDADPDEGAALYECARLPINSTADVYEVIEAIELEGGKRYQQGARDKDIFPYRFLCADPVDRFEKFAEISATSKYKKSKLNSKGKFEESGYTSVNELPEGYGYQYSRNELIKVIEDLKERTPHLIVTAHVKDKNLLDKKGEVISVKDIDLTGKLSQILCSMADAIGYVYRSSAPENKGELMISFETYESSVMGARQKYLAGQKFPFTWDRIYPDELVLDNGIYRLLTEQERAQKEVA